MVSCVERWMDDTNGATGIVHLSESLETNPSREMRRLSNAYDYFKSFFYAAKEGRLDSRLGFGSGVTSGSRLSSTPKRRNTYPNSDPYSKRK